MKDGLLRIKSMAKGQNDLSLLKVIKYLLTRNDMNDKYLNCNKNLKDMCDYIRSQAKAEAANGIAMIEEDIIYSWAINYFNEPVETEISVNQLSLF